MEIRVEGHFRMNPKTGRREWVDSYTRHVGGSHGSVSATGKLRDLMDSAHVDQTPGSRSHLEAHVAVHHEPRKAVLNRPVSSKAASQAMLVRHREQMLPDGPPTKDTPGWQEVKSRRGEGPRLAMTDEAWDQYSENAVARVRAAQDAGMTTGSQYRERVGDHTSPYTPERIAQQEKVIAAILDKAKNVPKERKAVMTGGLPGAGKSSSLTKQGVTDRGYFQLDSDDVKEEMVRQGMVPDVPGVTPLEASPLIHEESNDIANDLRERLAEQGTNVVIDGTMMYRPFVEQQLHQLLTNRYRVQGLFVNTDPEVAEHRTFARYRQGVEDYLAEGTGLGGRLVTREISQKARTMDPYNTFNALRDVFHSWVVYDNSGEGEPKLVDKSHDQVEFASPLGGGTGERSRVARLTKMFLDGKIAAAAVTAALDPSAKLPEPAEGDDLLQQDYARYTEVAKPNSLADIFLYWRRMTDDQRAEMTAAIDRTRRSRKAA